MALFTRTAKSRDDPSKAATGNITERGRFLFWLLFSGRWRSVLLPLRLLLIAPLVFATPALAQGTQQGAKTRPQNTIAGSRTPVATQPSNNPFHNPIGQGVRPAVSANPNLNGSQTNIAR